MTPKRLEHLTFKGNLKHTRYGWLRLTPAYSVHLVAELLDQFATGDSVVLDPFCGTGTTALVCAERGIHCDTTDINPFLIWLARTKTTGYSVEDIACLRSAAVQVASTIRTATNRSEWIPSLYQIEKWWDSNTVAALGRARCEIDLLTEHHPETVINLLKLAFCRTMIERANVSFGHQSMSFKRSHESPMLDLGYPTEEDTALVWERSIAMIASAANSPIQTEPHVQQIDARKLSYTLPTNRYTCVITSPPYPNRMSYIRELRPYMYWLGYLRDGREAGELDWQAIGGTWGSATSNVGKWQPESNRTIPFDGFDAILSNIAEASALLSRYVHKYFYDMISHIHEMFKVTAQNGTIHYIVGNSKFYDVLLPVEQIYIGLLGEAGFVDIEARTIRKRTSKKELFEYIVSARKP